MTRAIPAPIADFQAAADTLRDAALAAHPGDNTIPVPLSVVHAFANWLDDAGNDAAELGAPDPMALIAAIQVLYPRSALASGAIAYDTEDPVTKPETFGHEPLTVEDVFLGEMADDPPVCARCWRTVRTWSSWTTGHDERAGVQWENGWITYQDRVTWPCTTAVVLGLDPRNAR